MGHRRRKEQGRCVFWLWHACSRSLWWHSCLPSVRAWTRHHTLPWPGAEDVRQIPARHRWSLCLLQACMCALPASVLSVARYTWWQRLGPRELWCLDACLAIAALRWQVIDWLLSHIYSCSHSARLWVLWPQWIITLELSSPLWLCWGVNSMTRGENPRDAGEAGERVRLWRQWRRARGVYQSSTTVFQRLILKL